MVRSQVLGGNLVRCGDGLESRHPPNSNGPVGSVEGMIPRLSMMGTTSHAAG